MIKCVRINTCENITFENITLLSIEDQKEWGLPDLFEDQQICFMDDIGHVNLCHDEMVGLINIKKMKVFPDMFKVRRISITWDQITFSPAWIILPNLYEKYEIPHVYTELAKQFVFVADGHLFITKDDRVSMVELI